MATILSSKVPISQSLIVSDFRDINCALPFLANLSGFITNLSQTTYSRQDVAMKTFRLQDTAGRFVSCAVHGRHCIDEAFEDRAQVVVFFASASEGLGASPPMLWLYDSCHVIIQRVDCSVPPSTQAVPLGFAFPSRSGLAQAHGG